MRKLLVMVLALWANMASAECYVSVSPYPSYSPDCVSVNAYLTTTNKAQPLSLANSMPIQGGDNASVDASGRFRQSAPYGLFEDTRTDGLGTMVWEDAASGVGATSTWNSSESTVTLSVGTGPSDYEYRQSRYINYMPGASQLARVTFVFGAGVTNTAQRAGLFDDNDGMYFQQLGTTLSLCVRSSTSGSAVDSCTPQSSWNIDHFDGTGPSGITLDVTKTQLLAIDYLWQGVGRIRFGFMIDGRLYYVHQVLNANHIAVPFVSTPTLPLRYEIRNVGTTTGGTMKQICSSVESEGGYLPPGFEFSASNGITPVSITTRAPVLAIRLQTSFAGKPNRRTLRLLGRKFRVVTNDAFCELVHVHFPYTTTGGTWTAVSPDSGAEYNVGLTSVTGAMTHVVESTFLSAGQGSFSGGLTTATDFLNNHDILNQNAASNNSQMFVEYCTSFAGTAGVAAELNWSEVK